MSKTDPTPDKPNAGKNQMWGGRFAAGPSAVMEAINASIDIDKRLWREDIAGSKAHSAMLAKVGVISDEDAAAIHRGLDQVAEEIANDTFPFSAALEDIHMNIEARLIEIVGAPAERLHTGRSRNDQVATDFRLWVRTAAGAAAEAISDLQSAVVAQAAQHADTVMPGYTHLQTAQPVTFGHHCLAYVEMLERDRGRFLDAAARMNECPLGAAALAGTSFPLDRQMTAEELGFDQPTANSLDSVSARDFALEAASAASLTAITCSRLAEEIVLWTSPHFAFASLTDAFSTGSSIMPQKRNPDAAELCRAMVGRINAGHQTLLMVMKGLPLAYSKDMQEDKAATFAVFDALELVLAAMSGMVRDLTINKDAMRAAASGGYSTATDLADWLVRVLGLPFRRAHHVSGSVVAIAEQRGIQLDALTLEDMQSIEPLITEDVFSVLSVDASVASRTTYGGAAPANVREQAARWENTLKGRAS